MSRNPYLSSYRLQQRHRARVVGWWVVWAQALLPIGVAALLVPFVEPVFLGFLLLPPAQWGPGLEGLAQRAGLLLVAVLALEVYTALIRSPDRAILDLHPVDAGQVATFEVVRVARERAWLPVGIGVAFSPIALASPSAWGLLMVAVAGAYALGLTASAMMHLLAVQVSESERWAPLLDLLRGRNPRAQAAFLYAPGMVLAAAGSLTLLAARGVGAGWHGRPAALLLLALPFVAALAAWVPVAGLARQGWFRASTVLADIDARWAALEGRSEESHRVYLDWVVRWLPAATARYALKDLRHGWRGRRAWVTGPWLVGLVGLFAGWSVDPGAPAAATLVVVAGAWGFAAVGAVLDRDDPPFLSRWLPAEPGPRLAARLLALALWGQGTLWLPFFAVWLRHGLGAALGLLGFGAASLLLAVPVAAICGRSRAWGPWLYVPAAVLLGAATAALVTHGG